VFGEIVANVTERPTNRLTSIQLLDTALLVLVAMASFRFGFVFMSFVFNFILWLVYQSKIYVLLTYVYKRGESFCKFV
jgi:hypothetical protein